MKHLVIVHGYTGYPDKNWFPWLKSEAEKLGFKVDVPSMPNTNAPQLTEWLPALQKFVDTPNEDTFFVGHSLGCATILRYLEALDDGIKVGGVLLVAGFAEPIHLTELDGFTDEQWDDEKIKRSCKALTVMNSDNDEHVPLAMGNRIRDRFNAKLVVLHNAGHINEKSGYTEVPTVLEELQKQSS